MARTRILIIEVGDKEWTAAARCNFRTARPCSIIAIAPGKIEIVASKPMATQRDLSLAYSPGVAVPVNAIADGSTRPMTIPPRAILSP